jgi:hypothetical protein
MSTAITFDTLLHAKKLREAGFNETQAEIQAETLKVFSDQQAEVLKEAIEHRSLFNQDVLLLKTEIDKLRTEMKAGFKNLKLTDDSMKWKLNVILGLLTLFGTMITLAQFIQ